jgi:hypothetical protein
MATDRSLAELAVRLERIESLLAQRIPQVFDPPPDDLGRWGGWFPRPFPFPWPNPGDPVPIDISRLSRAQLEVSLQAIKAQRIRLDALESMIEKQLKQTK